MREEVGRSIGLSARKVQVRFQLGILSLITDLYHVNRVFRSGFRRVFFSYCLFW
jgi:hypothetical protein